jgi:hypothetical protein
MWFLVEAGRNRPPGSPPRAKSGWHRCSGQPWICPVRIGRCSTPCCPTPPRSPTRSMWSGWRTTSWMSAAAGSRTRPSAIGAARPTPCIGSAASSPRPTNASTTEGPHQAPRAVGCRRPQGRGQRHLARQRGHPQHLRDRRPGAGRRVRHPPRLRPPRPHLPARGPSLGRTLRRWKDHIVAWHRGRATNGPTEAVNNLIKRIKRIAFGFRRFRSFRIRALLYAGRPNWDLLATVTPR